MTGGGAVLAGLVHFKWFVSQGVIKQDLEVLPLRSDTPFRFHLVQKTLLVREPDFPAIPTFDSILEFVLGGNVGSEAFHEHVKDLAWIFCSYSPKFLSAFSDHKAEFLSLFLYMRGTVMLWFRVESLVVSGHIKSGGQFTESPTNCLNCADVIHAKRVRIMRGVTSA